MTVPANQGYQYHLPAVLDLRNVKDVRDALLQVSTGLGTVAVDGSSVARLSTAGAQVLLAFRHHLEKQDRRLAILQPSSTLSQALEMLGLKHLLLLPPTESKP